MRGLILPVLGAGVLLTTGAAGAIADEGKGVAAAATVAEAALGEHGFAQGQGQGRGQSEPRGEAKPRGNQEARGQGEGRGQAEARQQRPPQAQGQGKGQGEARPRGQGEGRGEGQGRAAGQREGRPAATGNQAAAPGRSGEARGRAAARGNAPHRPSPDRMRASLSDLAPPLRRMAGSDRQHERMIAGAVAHGRARGMDTQRIDVRNENGLIRLLNREGRPLLELDQARARDLGGWEMRRLGDRRPTGNSPAFCRSGEGHPVWGREWCLEKGFGLGSSDRTIWSRSTIDDVIFRRRDSRDRLDRGGLIDMLGDVVFGRLALHAVSMGLAEPLTGTWVAQEPDSPRILRVRSGNMEVAELVDRNRDDRVEVLYVVQPRW